MKQFSDFEPEICYEKFRGRESPVVIARWHIRTGRPIYFIMKIGKWLKINAGEVEWRSKETVM